MAQETDPGWVYQETVMSPHSLWHFALGMQNRTMVRRNVRQVVWNAWLREADVEGVLSIMENSPPNMRSHSTGRGCIFVWWRRAGTKDFGIPSFQILRLPGSGDARLLSPAQTWWSGCPPPLVSGSFLRSQPCPHLHGSESFSLKPLVTSSLVLGTRGASVVTTEIENIWGKASKLEMK